MDKTYVKLPPIPAKRWKSLIYKDQETLVRSLAGGLEQFLEKADQMELAAVSLHIIYLRSSICNQRPYFRLYLFDENLYNGNTDCWVYWEMSELTRQIQQTFPIETRPTSPDRRMETLLEQKHFQCAEFLYGVFGNMIQGLLDSAQKEMSCGISVPVYFGEYMIEQKFLYSPLSQQKGANADA